jgi:hypothetical protein
VYAATNRCSWHAMSPKATFGLERLFAFGPIENRGQVWYNSFRDFQPLLSYSERRPVTMNEEDRRKRIIEASMTMLERYWVELRALPPKSFVCGFCEDKVASAQGYIAKPSIGPAPSSAFIYICPSCGSPTLCDEHGDLFPKSPPGKPVANVPNDLAALYDEARRSAGAEAFTASVLTCRKILMNIAVENGAEEGKSFTYMYNI